MHLLWLLVHVGSMLWALGCASAAVAVSTDADVALNEIIESQYGSATLQSPASKLQDEVDILNLLNLTSKAPGVSLTEGPIKGFPAYKLRLPYGDALVSNATPIVTAMSAPEGFTVAFVFRQQRHTLGTLLSINSPGRLTPWFQVISNMRTGNLILRYRLSARGKLHQISWPLTSHHRKSWPLAAWTWLSVSADYNSSTLRLDVDCLPSRFEHLAVGEDTSSNSNQTPSRISVPQDSLVYFRQEPGRKKKFLGSIQVAKVLPHVTHQRLWTCREITENRTGQQHGQLKPVM